MLHAIIMAGGSGTRSSAVWTRWSRTNNIAVISAKSAHFAPGDTVTILTPNRHQYAVVGVAKFGTEDSPGGGSYALFTLPEAESLFTAPGKGQSVNQLSAWDAAFLKALYATDQSSKFHVTAIVEKMISDPAAVEVTPGAAHP